MKNILIKIIKFYQKIPGSFHQNCKYIPTCSNYGIEAIEKHGSINEIIARARENKVVLVEVEKSADEFGGGKVERAKCVGKYLTRCTDVLKMRW